MIPPGAVRLQKFGNGVIQILVTSSCNLHCYNCTQGSQLRHKHYEMSLQNFEVAVQSLVNFHGVVGVFGGNPCITKNFEEYCRILREYIPFHRRGLWSNNLIGKGDICRKTFNPATSNLNVHLDKDAWDEIKSTWPEAQPVGLKEDSRHSPVFVAMKDIIEDESERWKLISSCDININWSAGIAEFRGQPRAYFCEIAMAQSVLHQHEEDYPDTGIRLFKDGIYESTISVGIKQSLVCEWWRLGMFSFREQVRKHCHECSVPLHGYGELSQSEDGVEQTSKIHETVYKPKKSKRTVQVVEKLEQLNTSKIKQLTHYIQNGRI